MAVGEHSRLVMDTSIPCEPKPSDKEPDEKPADVKTSPLNASFEDVVRKTLEEWHIPGMAVAVIDGEDIWTQVSNVLGSMSSHRLSWQFYRTILNAAGLWLRDCPQHPCS